MHGYAMLITLLLCLVVTCQSRPDVFKGDIDAIITQIFATKATETPPETTDKAVTKSSTSSTEANPQKSDAVNLDELIIKDTFYNPTTEKIVDYRKWKTDKNCTGYGRDGTCVPYYLCKKEGYLDTPEPDTIDSHVPDDECASALEFCCLPDKTEKTPPPPPAQRVGCGWHNPDGVVSPLPSTVHENDITQIGEFPWVCAIFKVEDNPKPTYIGSGSLIHPSVVLTTAHSVYGAGALRIRAGEFDAVSVMEPYTHQDRDVASVDIHKDFRKQTLFYDVALLFLSTPVELRPNVGVACLPPSREAPAGTQCIATGWGKDKFGDESRYEVLLRKVEMPVVDHATCQSQLRRTRLGSRFQLHSSFMCAGGGDKDLCRADGGAPLVCPIEDKEEAGRFTQRGMVAWSIGCEGPGAFVDVANVREWIDDKVVGKGYDPKTYSY